MNPANRGWWPIPEAYGTDVLKQSKQTQALPRTHPFAFFFLAFVRIFVIHYICLARTALPILVVNTVE